jgi:peptidoglycan/LPS O-acetylase OafA/YrhL
MESSIKYIKEYDSLRAIAVIFVIISHSFPNSSIIHKMPFGFIGVSFFFVLSGKLITSILLNAKSSKNTLSNNLKTFYVRRTIRIFPAYYLFLGTCLFLGSIDMKEHYLYFLSYTQNILFFKTANYAGMLSPTWTLAVEEQFYLIWPLFILLIRKKYLKKAIIACIIISPLFRVFAILLAQKYNQSSALNLALMPSNLICLCIGGLLSLLESEESVLLTFIYNKFVPFVALIISLPIIHFTKNGFLVSIMQQVLISILSVWTLYSISANKDYFLNKVLKNKITTYLGKISYGMYLYHTIASVLIFKLFGYSFDSKSDIRLFTYNLLSTITVSSISWFLFEKSINSFKKYISYE